MRLETLKEGLEFKNMIDMCEKLELEYKDSTNSRQAIMKEVERYVEISREGRRLTIVKVYDTPKEKIDGRINSGQRKNCRGNNRKHFESFKADEEHWKSIGVYGIIRGRDIYIGSTIVGFRMRFHGHKDKSNPLVTNSILDDGGCFFILEVCNGKTEEEIRTIENDYIEKYRADEFYNVLNSNNSVREALPPKPKIKQTPKPKYKTIRVRVLEEDYEEALDHIRELEDNGVLAEIK